MSSDELVSPIPCPAAWPLAHLKTISKKIGSGATPSGGQAAYQGSRTNFALVRSQNVCDRSFSESGLAFISDDQASGLKGVRLEEEDLLLNITGDGVTFGRACMVPPSVLPACVNQHVSIIRLDRHKADPGYVLSYLTHPAVKGYIEAFNAGGSRRAITKAHIESFVVPLPPLSTQTTIAQMLSTLDDRIVLLRETNATLESTAQALFKSWFVDFDAVRAKMEGRAPEGMDEATAALFPDALEESELGLVPKGWRVGTLGEHTSYLNRGISPKYIEDGGIVVINQKCIRDFSLDLSKARRHDPAQRKVDGRELLKGDILVNSTGVGTLGRVAQVLSLTSPAIVDSHVTVIRAGTALTWNYLGLLVMRRQSEIEGMGEGSTGQTELSRGKLAALKLLIPSASVLREFDDVVLPLRERFSANQTQAQTLAALRDTLLPRLISGQLRLPEAQSQLEDALS
ncbi:MAG: restriction endonuclease subunit S [Rhodoferax sp.]|nr:restriction endonuclease subunit S [Rhodoferax sp.]